METVQWIVEPFMQGDNYSSTPVLEWTQEHTEVPVFCVCAYLAFVFWVPEMLEGREPMKLKALTALWNLTLSVFSFAGLLHTVPVLLQNVFNKGYRHTVCTDPVDWYQDGKSGLWVMLFIYSKIPELMDTVFLVLRKRPVIFLHWFHHCTVLLYCWHAYQNRIAPGLWFASMNYTVHSVMYLYYFLQTWFRKQCKLVAPLITTIQIVQMLVGCTVVVSSTYFYTLDGRMGPEGCFVDLANLKLGLGMYGVYFVLFAMLFKKLYLSPAKKSGTADMLMAGRKEGRNAGASWGKFPRPAHLRRTFASIFRCVALCNLPLILLIFALSIGTLQLADMGRIVGLAVNTGR